MSHQIALTNFYIFLSKTKNRKFYPIGICNKGDGLVGMSVNYEKNVAINLM